MRFTGLFAPCCNKHDLSVIVSDCKRIKHHAKSLESTVICEFSAVVPNPERIAICVIRIDFEFFIFSF